MSVVVYTTIFGGSDSLKPAPVGADRCVCFVDQPALCHDAQGWDLVTRVAGVNPRRDAWRMRALAHDLFRSYDKSVWIDASFTLTNLPLLLAHADGAAIAALRHHRRSSCYAEAREVARVGQATDADVAGQMDVYRKAGFQPNGLSISCIVVRTNSDAVRAFNETWHAETSAHRGDNTQLSLDYSAWKHGLSIRALRGTRHNNPYATHDHEDHKRRRQPYRNVA